VEPGEEKTLERAEELFDKGSKAIEEGDFIDTVDCLSRALEIRLGFLPPAHGPLPQPKLPSGCFVLLIRKAGHKVISLCSYNSILTVLI
jgi:hypothetical protein